MAPWMAETLGTSIPLVLAPMAGPGGGQLANAVSLAGGFGMVGVGSTTSADWIRDQARLAGAGGARYGLGLMAWAQPDAPIREGSARLR